MEYFDPHILNMVLVLPGLLGLSYFYEGVQKKRQENKSWWLSLFSGTLVLVTVVLLFFVFQSL